MSDSVEDVAGLSPRASDYGDETTPLRALDPLIVSPELHAINELPSKCIVELHWIQSLRISSSNAMSDDGRLKLRKLESKGDDENLLPSPKAGERMFRSASVAKEDMRLTFYNGVDKVMLHSLFEIREVAKEETKEFPEYVFVYRDVPVTHVQENLLLVSDLGLKSEIDGHVLIQLFITTPPKVNKGKAGATPKIVVVSDGDDPNDAIVKSGKREWIRHLTKTATEQESFIRATKRNLFDFEDHNGAVSVDVAARRASEPSVSRKSSGDVADSPPAKQSNLRLSREISKGGASKSTAPYQVAPYVSEEWQIFQHDDFLDKLHDAMEGIPEEYVKVSFLNFDAVQYRFQTAEETISMLRENKHNVMRLSTPGRESNQHVSWIDIEGAHVDEITELGRFLQMHPLTIEDCSSAHARQKLEPFENYLFIVLRSLHHIHYSDNKHQNPIKMVIFGNLVVTFHRYPSFAILTAMERMKKLHSGNYFKSKYVQQIESMDILHVILDSLTETDSPIVSSLDVETEVLKQMVYEHSMSDDFDLLRVSCESFFNIF
jgi:hypothetical protein